MQRLNPSVYQFLSSLYLSWVSVAALFSKLFLNHSKKKKKKKHAAAKYHLNAAFKHYSGSALDGDANSIQSHFYTYTVYHPALVQEWPVWVVAVIDEVWKKSQTSLEALDLCY